MQLPLFTGVTVVGFLVVLRHYGARRVAASEGQFIWLMFVPTLIGGFAILGVGIEMLVTVPPAGVVMAITGSIYIAALIGFLTRAARSGPLAMTEPLGDYASTLVGLLLIGGLAALVGLVVWGVSQAAR